MTLNDFLNMWRKKDEYTYTNYAPTWKDKALEDCYRFFQMMSDEDTLVIDCQYEELCLVDLFGSVERNISEEDANFLIDKFGFKATKRAKEAMGKESKKEILNNAERTHLKRAIKPFRDKVRRIVKTKEISTFMKNREFILIYFTDEMQRDNTLFVILEDFEEGTMYKGMEEGKAYTIDELRL